MIRRLVRREKQQQRLVDQAALQDDAELYVLTCEHTREDALWQFYGLTLRQETNLWCPTKLRGLQSAASDELIELYPEGLKIAHGSGIGFLLNHGLQAG